MTNPRPFFLNLVTIALPVGGWVSILHRASGAALAVVAPALVYLLMLSLESPAGFAQATAWLGSGLGLLVSLGLIWATLHHFVAGLRHLGFDVGLGESRLAARRSAWATLAVTLSATGLIAFAVLS